MQGYHEMTVFVGIARGRFVQGIFSQGSKPRRVWQSKHHMV
jgi:hypothetical protein